MQGHEVHTPAALLADACGCGGKVTPPSIVSELVRGQKLYWRVVVWLLLLQHCSPGSGELLPETWADA